MNSILLILLFHFSSFSNDINIIRDLYLSAYTSEENCNKLGEKLSSIDRDKSILIKGYEGCFYFIKCKFINNPIEKIIYFNKGKELLEAAINQKPKSVELRFLRYSIQKNIPRFLLYDNIEKDLNFVNNNIEGVSDMKAQAFITSSIKSITK